MRSDVQKVMAIKIKREPIPLDDDDEDEEALRLAALQTLKAKQEFKPSPSTASQSSSAISRPPSPGHALSGPAAPRYRPVPPYRHPAPSLRPRHPRPPYTAPLANRGAPPHTGFQIKDVPNQGTLPHSRFQGHMDIPNLGTIPNTGFQTHMDNPNLISIVPVSDVNSSEPVDVVSNQKQGHRFQGMQKPQSVGDVKQKSVSSSSGTTDAEKPTVPSKFSRIDASDSESDDDLLTKKKNSSEDEIDDADNEPECNKNKSDQSSNSEDDSLEKLMEEMEQEMNRTTSETSKTTNSGSKKQKQPNEKKKKKSGIPATTEQIPRNVIEDKIINIKKEKEDVEKVEPKPIMKTGGEMMQTSVNIKPVVGIAKPTCIEPFKVKIKQEPKDPDIKDSLPSAPKNNILEKVLETSSLSPIRIKSPTEVNLQIKTELNPPLNDDVSKENKKSSLQNSTSSQDKKNLSPTKSTCSSPVEFVERSPVSPITVENSPKSDRTDLLDEDEFFKEDKEQPHSPRKFSRSPHRSNSPVQTTSRKFSRSPSPRGGRLSPGKNSFYHDSGRGSKINGRTFPPAHFPNKNRVQNDHAGHPFSPYYSRYSPKYYPPSPSYSPYDHCPASDRSRSPHYSTRNHPNTSSLYTDEQNSRYRSAPTHVGDSVDSRPLSRYPPFVTSPRRRSRSPRRLSRSPRRWSRSPRRLSRSPRRLSRSPRRLSRSPRGLSRSPRRMSRSPRRFSRSPRRLSRSPRRLSRSPRRLTRSPRRLSRSPSPKSRSPRRYIERPSRRRSPWNSRVQNSFATSRRCVSRSPTPHLSRDIPRLSSKSPPKVHDISSKRSPVPESGQERQPQLREPPSPSKHSRSPVPTSRVGSPSRAKRASVSPLRSSKATRSPRRELSPRNFDAGQRYRQRSLSPTQAHSESRHRQSSLSPKRKEPIYQKDQTNSHRRYSPGRRRQMPPRRYHPHMKSRSPPRKTSPLQTQYKNPADKWEQNWSSDYQSSRRVGTSSQPLTSKSLSPPPAGDSSRQRSRSPVRDGADTYKSRRRSPQNSLRRRREFPADRNRERERRDRRRDFEREKVQDRSREKSKADQERKEKDTATGKTEQESIQDKEPVVNDPVMEARRRKFQSKDLVQPVSKKICLKSKSSSNKVADSPEVTREEEISAEEKLPKEDDDDYQMKNAGEESDEMLDLDRYDKTCCTSEDVLDLGADNLLWEDDVTDWNRKVEVSVKEQVPEKRSKGKVKDLRCKVSEKRRHKHKTVTDKACSPLVESRPAKKKRLKEAISVDNEPQQEELEYEEEHKQQETIDNHQEDPTDENQECQLKDERTVDSESKGTTNEDCDLRAELSRRRAERLTKAGSVHESLPKRLLQSAFQGLIGLNRTDSKGLKAKESKQKAVVQSKVQPLPKAEMPVEPGKRRVLLLERKPKTKPKTTRKASFQIGLKVTKESDSDSLPSYSEDDSEENEDDSLDQSDSDGEDVDGRTEELLTMKRKQLARQERPRLPVKCRLGSALDRGLKQKRKFFRRNQV